MTAQNVRDLERNVIEAARAIRDAIPSPLRDGGRWFYPLDDALRALDARLAPAEGVGWKGAGDLHEVKPTTAPHAAGADSPSTEGSTAGQSGSSAPSPQPAPQPGEAEDDSEARVMQRVERAIEAGRMAGRAAGSAGWSRMDSHTFRALVAEMDDHGQEEYDEGQDDARADWPSAESAARSDERRKTIRDIVAWCVTRGHIQVANRLAAKFLEVDPEPASAGKEGE